MLDYNQIDLVQFSQYNKFSFCPFFWSARPPSSLVQRVQLRLAGIMIGCHLDFNEILLLM